MSTPEWPSDPALPNDVYCVVAFKMCRKLYEIARSEHSDEVARVLMLIADCLEQSNKEAARDRLARKR